MQPLPDLAHVQSTVRSLDIGLRWVMTFALVCSGGYATKIMLTVPAQQKIFEDMLGSLSKLPELTQWLIQSFPAAILLAWALFLVVVILLWICRPPALALFFGGLGCSFLLCLGAIFNFGLQTPLMQIIQGINSNV